MFSIGGIAILSISIWQFFKKKPIEAFKRSLLIFAVVTAHIQIGYFTRIDDSFITIPDALLVFNGTIAATIIYSRSKKITISIPEITFIFTILFGIIALVANPYPEPLVPLGNSWTAVFSGAEEGRVPSFGSSALIYILRLLLFLSIVWLIILERDKFIFSEFVKNFVIFSAPFIYIYFLEFLLKLFLRTNIILDLGNIIFGRAGAQLDFLLERGGILALQGLTLEPNFITQSIFIFILAYLTSSPRQLWVRISFALAYPLLIFSGSLQSIIVIAASLPFLLMHGKIAQRLFVSFFIFATLLVLAVFQINSEFFDYFSNRLILITQLITDYESSKYELIYKSEAVRTLSVIENFRLSTFNGFLGVGLGSTFAHGFVASAVSNIGIAGFLTWFWMMHRLLNSAGYRMVAWKVVLLLISLVFIGNIHLLYYPTILIFGITAARPEMKRTVATNF